MEYKKITKEQGRLKKKGFSDFRIAELLNVPEEV